MDESRQSGCSARTVILYRICAKTGQSLVLVQIFLLEYFRKKIHYSLFCLVDLFKDHLLKLNKLVPRKS
jgi:hypothetical protein